MQSRFACRPIFSWVAHSSGHESFDFRSHSISQRSDSGLSLQFWRGPHLYPRLWWRSCTVLPRTLHWQMRRSTCASRFLPQIWIWCCPIFSQRTGGNIISKQSDCSPSRCVLHGAWFERGIWFNAKRSIFARDAERWRHKEWLFFFFELRKMSRCRCRRNTGTCCKRAPPIARQYCQRWTKCQIPQSCSQPKNPRWKQGKIGSFTSCLWCSQRRTWCRQKLTVLWTVRSFRSWTTRCNDDSFVCRFCCENCVASQRRRHTCDTSCTPFRCSFA